jgi:Ca2+-binding RTX toxin-like protein
MAGLLLRYFPPSALANELDELLGGAFSNGVFVSAAEDKVILKGDEGRLVLKGEFVIANGVAVGGHVTAFASFVGGERLLKGNGYDIPFADFVNALGDNDLQFFLMLRLLTAEQVLGSKGDDTIFGLSPLIRGDNGDDAIFTNFGDSEVRGGRGDDLIVAGTGDDLLFGGRGNDVFGFVDEFDGIDRIADFSVAKDRIALDDGGFAELGPTVEEAEFVIGSKALTAEQRLIYNPGNGKLFWDENGVGGPGKILLAELPSGLAPTAANFFIDDFT